MFNKSDTNSTIKKVTDLEDQFNKLLVQYNTLYKTMTQELMSHNNNPVFQKYSGKNVKHQNNFYYINNFGVAHAYDNKTWKNRDNSCKFGQALSIADTEFSKLLSGPKMGAEQACDVAGFNIKNNTSGETSFVDIKGVRHVFPKDILDKRTDSCQGTALNLSDTAYKNIPTGDIMTEDNLCLNLNVNSNIIKTLAKLNTQLLNLGKQLQNITEKAQVNDLELKNKLNLSHKNTLTQIQRLENDKHQLNNNKINLGHGSGSLTHNETITHIKRAKRNSEIFLNMNFTNYVIGSILLLLLIIFTIHNFSSETPSIIALIVVICVILYYVWKRFF